MGEWVWRCLGCDHSDLTHVQQRSKTRGVGRCYWCGPNMPVMRVEVEAEQAELERASRPEQPKEGDRG